MLSRMLLEARYSRNFFSSSSSMLLCVELSRDCSSTFFAALGSFAIETKSLMTYSDSSLTAESRTSSALRFRQSNVFFSLAHLSNNCPYPSARVSCRKTTKIMPTRQTVPNVFISGRSSKQRSKSKDYRLRFSLTIADPRKR